MGLFRFKLFATTPGETIKLRAPAGLGDSPLGFNPSAFFQPMQRRVKRTLFQRKTVARNNGDAFGDIPPVQGRSRQRPKNKEIQRSLEEFVAHLFHGRNLIVELRQ